MAVTVPARTSSLPPASRRRDSVSVPAPFLTSVPSPASRPTSFVVLAAGAMVATESSYSPSVPRPLMDANDSSACLKEIVASASSRIVPPAGVYATGAAAPVR